jgi:signal transduction histidine kinase
MVDAAQRTDAMLRDLVEFVELYVSGTTPISRRKVDLKLLCERVIDSMQGSNPESSIVFTCGASVEGCWDPDRLAVLLSRLIENALEHGPARRPIRVTVAGSESSAVLEVASARPIIDAALLAHIFEPFVRGTCNPLDGDSGLGLGLFLAQAVARAHGGQINLTCDSVTGTTFRVTLPRA